MKDYAEMSNFEINSAVSMALLDKSANPSARYVAIGDYCNNPADAWPIITANKISIYAMSEADNRGHWGAEAFYPNEAYHFNDNPLRAAMIVFLMMQESANVPANSTGSDIR